MSTDESREQEPREPEESLQPQSRQDAEESAAPEELAAPEGSAAPEESAAPEPPQPEPVGAEPVNVAAVADATRVRRAPRFGSFVFTAVILAALLAGLATFVRDAFLPPEELVGRALDAGGMFLLLWLGLSSFFVLAAYGIAVALDRRSVRRMERSQEASRTGAETTPHPAPDRGER